MSNPQRDPDRDLTDEELIDSIGRGMDKDEEQR